ncbi:MAG: alpha-2-macroglobulin [Chloroflexi bacterium]|nr:alpha-2-macroglobulin [Chloroflexota bacterium]
MQTSRVSQVLTTILLVSLLTGACSLYPSPSPSPTPSQAQSIPVTVIQRTPERGEELNLDGAIELIFDRPMDRSSVERALRVSPRVQGRFTWPDTRTVRFQPARSLKRDTQYQVSVDANAKATDGNTMGSTYSFRFRTVGYLEVAQVIPAPDTDEVEASSTITVIFNRPVVPLMTVSDLTQADLPQPLTLDPPVEGSGEWLNTSIYVFSPTKALAGGVTYSARIASGLADTTGGVMADDYRWSFTTQPPQITWTAPRDREDLVPIGANIQMSFNMPIDAESAGAAFRLSKGDAQIPGRITVSGPTLIFTPAQSLEFNTTYAVSIARDVQSLSGGQGMGENYTWQFTTVPLPRIVETDPDDGQNDVWPYTAFRIMFNTPIDPSTVMRNLTMTPPLSPALVYTYYSSHDHTFVVEFGAQPSTDYSVSIAPNIADPYGNTTGQQFTVRFRTAPLPSWIQLNPPSTVGTMDASAPARVLVSSLNTGRLNFKLYRLEQEDLLQAQQTWWEYEPTGQPVRQWSVAAENVLNETQHIVVELVENQGNLTPGIYLLDVKSPDVEFDRWAHRRLIVASELNLTLKKGQDELWVWVTDLATGRPTANVSLTAWDDKGDRIGSSITDGEGLASFPLGPDLHYGTVTVASHQPFVVGGSGWEWSTGISPWDFGIEQSQQDGAYRAHIYTDRPIYRPGQTTYFRGIVRAERDVHYAVPQTNRVEVTIYDAAGEQVHSEGLELDRLGAFHSEFVLPQGASLGQYNLQASFGREVFYSSFQVAAYRPPEFEVNVAPGRTDLASEQTAEVTFQLSYYFGGPVADTTISWNVLSTTHRFEPVQFARYDFSDRDDPWVCLWCRWWEPEAPEVILSGTGTTDAQGQFQLSLPTSIMTGGQQLILEGTAVGRDGQTISGRATMIVHPGDFYIGLAAQQATGRVDRPTMVDVVTVDWEGERWPDQPLDVQIYRRDWNNSFVEDDLGGGTWEWQATDTLVFTGSLQTDENAEGVVNFIPDRGGSYRVIVSGYDSGERPVRSSTWIWVSGDGDISWRRENNDRFTLISDRASYVPGDTAEILIPSPFVGEQWAWLTIERGGILHQDVVKLETNSTIYEFPITNDYAPNIYVSVVIVRGPDDVERVASHKVGYVELTVRPVEQSLAVTITPSMAQAEPGSTVTFQVEARDSTGEPVQAGFSLDVVDKAILSLHPREPDQIVDAFYGQRGLGILTSSGMAISVNRWLFQEMDQYQELELAANGIGGDAEAELAAALPAPTRAAVAEDKALSYEESQQAPQLLRPGVQLREEYLDTAFWNGAVTTGQNGRAIVTVSLPDNLTTWVVRSVGVTADTQVGAQTIDLLVTKPLLVRPVTPRFFVAGDRVELAALVSNNTGAPQDVTVTLEAVGLTLDSSAAQNRTIANTGEERFVWWVTAEDVQAASVVMSAVSDEFSDAARPRLTTAPDGLLPILRYSAPEVVGTGGQLTDAGSRTEMVSLPPRYDDRRGELAVRLDPSLAASMIDGLDYLEHFPYECTEQTVSRFLPNVLTYAALRDLGQSDPELEARLPDLVREGVDRLVLQQNTDGGWGWWAGGQSSPHLSAYVVFALTQARDAGFDIPAETIDSGLNYLEGTLVSVRELTSFRQANQQAFTLYVMAVSGQSRRASEYVDALYRQRGKLSHYGHAFLAMTINLIKPGEARIATLLSDLQNAAILSATGTHWEEQDHDRWAMNTDTRSTAVILDAMIRLDPDNALNPSIVRWLMTARRDGIWETTQETAWAIIALTDWMVTTGELHGDYDFSVWLDQQRLAEGRALPDTIDQPVQVSVPISDLRRQISNPLLIERGPGNGSLYYTAHLKVYLPVEDVDPLHRGIIVSREYHASDCAGEHLCPDVDEASIGDAIQVKLTIIAPHDLYYVVVEDPLPAGAEAIDASLATVSLLEQEPALYRDRTAEEWGRYDWWRWYNRSELRDDRVVLFADYLPAGTYEYVYAFRATQTGQYQVLPAFAQEFYFPEVFGRSNGRQFTITEQSR